MPIGSAIGAVGSIIAADRVSSASAKSAAETNAYNRENYKHRYQWQVKDMRKAGLNPALSYTTGAGTPTGGVQQTEFGGSQYNEASQQVGSAMSKLSTQMLQREQINNAKNMNAQIQAQTENLKSQTNIANMKVIDEIANINSQTAKNRAETHYGNPIKTIGSGVEAVADFIVDNDAISTAKDAVKNIIKNIDESSKPFIDTFKGKYKDFKKVLDKPDPNPHIPWWNKTWRNRYGE